MKKKVLSVLLAAAMVASLAACGGSSAPAAEPAKEEAPAAEEEAPAEEEAAPAEEEAPAEEASAELSGEMTIIHYLTETAKVAAFEELVAGFEAEYPGVKVNAESLPMDNYSDVVKMRFSTGENPDVIFGQPKSYKELVEGGLIKDLSGYDWINRLSEGSKKCVTVNDGLYGAPLDQMGNVVFYNKEIFAEQGLSVPTTWSEFVAVCDALKAAGITPCAAGYGDDISFGANWYTIFYGTPYTNHPNSAAEQMEGASFFDYPEFRQALEQWRTIMNNYQNDDRKQVKTADAEQKFANGETAMIIIGTWGLGAIMDFGPEFEVGGFAYPSEEDASKVCVPLNIDDCWMVSEGSANEELALAFLEFATRSDVNSKWCGTASQLSALDGVVCETLPSGAVDIANEINSKPASAWASVSTYTGQFSTVYTQANQAYSMNDDMTPDEWLQMMDDGFAAARD